MCEADEVIILKENIIKAFSWREKPLVLTNSDELTADELLEIVTFSKISWQDTTSSLWEKNFDVIHFFSPKAFQYFLPGILIASVVDNIPSLIVCEDIISSLNRSPNYDGWEDHFIKCWGDLSIDEYIVIEEWLLWQSNFTKSQDDNLLLSIALRTIEICKSVKYLPSQQDDEETDLHNNRQRYYDPVLGRYINQKPIGL